MTEAQEHLQITIARGNIYIPFAAYDRYFKNIEAIALLPHENGILIFPLIQQSAGGLILKVRNLQGDRIIHAQEFFRSNNYAETFEEAACEVMWNSVRHALLVHFQPNPQL